MAVQIAVSLGPKTRRAITILVDILLLAGVIGCIYLAISFLGVGGASDGQTSTISESGKNNKPLRSTTHVFPQANQSSGTGTAHIRIPARTPEDAIKGFYDALKQGKCGEALKLRPDYNRCEQIHQLKYGSSGLTVLLTKKV